MLSAGNSIFAQDTVRHLIISEVRVDTWSHAYVELTNMGDTALNLSQFTYTILRDNYPTFHREGDVVYLDEGIELWSSSSKRLSGILQPGESYLIMAVQDGLNNDWIYPQTAHSMGLLQRADNVVHFPDWDNGDILNATHPYNPDWEMWGMDSVDSNYSVMLHRHTDAPALFWHRGDSVTVLIDQALGTINWVDANSGHYINETDPPKSVAGVESAHDDYTLVRKFTVKEGETNWSIASGIDAETSSWMLIPSNNELGHMPFETEGTHGNFSLDLSSTVYGFDIGEGIIRVPWGTEKYDSIRLGLDLGPGMAWEYRETGELENLRSTICQTGDSLILYCAGNDLKVLPIRIEVDDPVTDMVQAFAKKTSPLPTIDEIESDIYTPATLDGILYGITKNEPVIDRIFNIPFATPVDTLMDLLEIAPNSTYQIIWASGSQSSEVSNGDILRITAGDGATTKDYLLSVEPYMGSDNVLLRAITWPDRPADFMGGWNGDTIPGFSSNGTYYNITLPLGTTNIPALYVQAQDLNAKLDINRATSLSGGVSERTTTITVTSESDTTISIVRIIFQIENPNIQQYVSDPIFSKFIIRDWWSGGGIEIANPSDKLLDLSQYMIVKTDAFNPADAITSGFGTDSTAWFERWLKIVPGYKWQNYENWLIQPGILVSDPAIDPIVDPKDVKVFWRLHPSGEWRAYQDQMDPALGGRADYIINNDIFEPGVYYNPWNEPISPENTFAFPLFPTGVGSKFNYFMFRISNDSILNGTKAANDPNDFELVDAFGHPDVPWVLNGITWQSPPAESWTALRKPDKYWGVNQLGDNFGDVANSHYTLTQDYGGDPQRRTVNQLLMGSYDLYPITGHLSTVSSLAYRVSLGYEGDQSIEGVSRSETVSDFLANIIKNDIDQSLEVRRDGVISGSTPVTEGDTLLVTSKTGNTTLYIISANPLDDNALLSAKGGSGLSIDVNGSSGTVSGFDYGETIRNIFENVNLPVTALLNVVDFDDNLVPFQKLNSEGIYVDLIATSEIYFEVIAENGDIITYQLQPTTLSSDAYVLSDSYTVSEDPVRILDGVPLGTNVSTLLENLLPVDGATLRILIKSGQERTTGALVLDDRLEVTSEDGTVINTYLLKFVDNEIILPNTEPVASLDNDILNVKTFESFKLKVNAADDGLPGPLSYRWSVVGGNHSMVTIMNPELQETDITITQPGSYRLQVTVSDGEFTVTLLMWVISEVVEVEVMEDPHIPVKVYPNPATDYLIVESDFVSGWATLTIYDLLGTALHISELVNPVEKIYLDGLSPGVYLLTVKTERDIQYKRIQLQ